MLGHSENVVQNNSTKNNIYKASRNKPKNKTSLRNNWVPNKYYVPEINIIKVLFLFHQKCNKIQELHKIQNHKGLEASTRVCNFPLTEVFLTFTIAEIMVWQI